MLTDKQLLKTIGLTLYKRYITQKTIELRS